MDITDDCYGFIDSDFASNSRRRPSDQFDSAHCAESDGHFGFASVSDDGSHGASHSDAPPSPALGFVPPERRSSFVRAAISTFLHDRFVQIVCGLRSALFDAGRAGFGTGRNSGRLLVLPSRVTVFSPPSFMNLILSGRMTFHTFGCVLLRQ
jgi:hypothetical protein